MSSFNQILSGIIHWNKVYCRVNISLSLWSPPLLRPTPWGLPCREVLFVVMTLWWDWTGLLMLAASLAMLLILLVWPSFGLHTRSLLSNFDKICSSCRQSWSAHRWWWWWVLRWLQWWIDFVDRVNNQINIPNSKYDRSDQIKSYQTDKTNSFLL